MVTPASMDPAGWLRQQLEHADTDLLREMVRSFAVCGADYRTVSNE